MTTRHLSLGLPPSVKILVESEGRRYVISQTYSRYGWPANSGVSADATPDRIRQINPKVRSPGGERAHFGNGVDFDIYSGPLHGAWKAVCR